MADKTFLIQFKPPELSIQPVIAACAEIQGEHLVLLNSEGELAALFLMENVESWSEIGQHLSAPVDSSSHIIVQFDCPVQRLLATVISCRLQPAGVSSSD